MAAVSDELNHYQIIDLCEYRKAGQGFGPSLFL